MVWIFTRTLTLPFVSSILPQHTHTQVRLPVEECVSKRVELSEGLLGVDHQSVAGDDSFGVAVHHRDEGIRGGFGADPHAGEILLQQVAAEARWCDGALHKTEGKRRDVFDKRSLQKTLSETMNKCAAIMRHE